MSAFYTTSVKSNFADLSIVQVDDSSIGGFATDCLGFIINYENDEQAERELAYIRQHDNPNIYLRGVVLALSNDSPTNHISKRFDSVITHQAFNEVLLNELQRKFTKLNSWIAKIPNNDNTLSDTTLRFKTLRLMTSRDARCAPNLTIHDKRGFEYSLISPIFSKSDGSLEQVLAFLLSQQLVTEQFVKKAHFCPHCDSAFLNFKETCPDCSSDNLQVDELIHHFKCGHTDVVGNFSKKHHLQCPKCGDELKHIGVDYDKPSTISNCLNCSLAFQEPEVKADCFACHRVTSSDDLVLRTMSAYSASAIGANAARYGLDALFTSILQTDLNLYSNVVVDQFITIEKARIERYKKTQTSLTVIHFSNLEAVFDNLGRKTEQMFKEISAVFKSVFRESDLITARNESLFAVVMTETPTDNAHLAIKRLKEAINGLFEENLNFTLEINTHVANINEVQDVNSTIDQFITIAE